MLSPFELLQADLIINMLIAEHLAEEGDESAFDSLDAVDLAYFDQQIVLAVIQEDPL